MFQKQCSVEGSMDTSMGNIKWDNAPLLQVMRNQLFKYKNRTGYSLFSKQFKEFIPLHLLFSGVQISAVKECMYDDAFTIQEVHKEHISIANFAAGTVPPIQQLIRNIKHGDVITNRKAHILQNVRKLLIMLHT